MLEVAARHRLAVVPFGGGTSVVGGLVARREGFAGVLSLDLVRMKRLLAVDPVSMTATLEPGLRGPEAEALLAEHGLTLGHFPQSFEFATIGGFAATRSSGQSSAGYGRFDALVLGLDRRHPRRTGRPRARPGERGRARPAPAVPRVRGRLRRDHVGDRPGPPRPAGARATRAGACRPSRPVPTRCARSPRRSCCPTVLRLSDETETAINLAHPDAVGAGTAQAAA